MRRFPATLAVLAAALSLGTTACGQKTSPPASSASTTDVPVASPAVVQDLAPSDFVAKLADSNVVVLDVRTPGEFASGHVKGAMNMDMTAPDFAQKIAALDKGKTFVLYCRSGNRSGRAAAQMQAAGFASLFNAGGFDALVAAGAPAE
ncbi:MAG: rhodanese-like domain-containing protein [Bacteroidetes bacterium]|nr:rhodanese-like domain-containing protein [Bacteroidota bacterium]